MKTPKIFTDNLKNKTITREMLGIAIYSVNKRAKNCRDKSRQYRCDSYRDKYNEKKEEYYHLKELFLTLVKPNCIHEEHLHTKQRQRYYEYDDEYDYIESVCDVIKYGSYWDRDMRRRIEFVDVYEKVECTNYYLYYDFDDYSFHTPIFKSNLKKYDNLKIIKIDGLKTSGKDINDLISMQFVKKLKELIESNDYHYIDK